MMAGGERYVERGSDPRDPKLRRAARSVAPAQNNHMHEGSGVVVTEPAVVSRVGAAGLKQAGSAQVASSLRERLTVPPELVS